MMPRYLKKMITEVKRTPFNSIVGTLSLLLGLGTLGTWRSHLINLGREWFFLLYLPTLVIGSFWLYFRVKNRVGRLGASGVSDYYSRYDPDHSYQTFWKKIDNSYRYLGISGATFRRDIKKFMNSDGQHVKYEFLLLDPQSAYLRQVERERLDLAPDDQSQTSRETLDEHVASKQKEFEATVAAIRTTIPFSKPGQVRLKVYDAYPAFWMEILDEDTILLGLLTKRLPGHQSPLLVLKQSSDYNFFDSAMDQWTRLWGEARDYP